MGSARLNLGDEAWPPHHLHQLSADIHPRAAALGRVLQCCQVGEDEGQMLLQYGVHPHHGQPRLLLGDLHSKEQKDQVFEKAFAEYEEGFSVGEESWLGLKQLAELTKEGKWELKVEFTSWGSEETKTATYTRFS